jgi:hypothetical protein
LRDVFAGKRNNFLSPTFDDIKKQIETIPELKRIFLNDQVKIMQNDQEIKILIDCIRRQLNTDEIATFWSDEDVRSVLLKQRWSKIVERHMSRGLGPSHEIHLPIDLSKLDPNRLPSDGLNPLAMIDAMAKIAKDGQEFNIIDNNCCVATSTALSCGAQDHMNRNLYFMQSEFYNAAFTPHSVMKAAIAYQKSINNLSAPLQIQDSKLLNTAAKATTKAVRNVQDERLGYVRRTANAIGVVLGGVFTAALARVNRSNSDLRSTPLLPGLAASASHRPHDSDTAQPDIKSRTKKTTSNNNRL